MGKLIDVFTTLIYVKSVLIVLKSRLNGLIDEREHPFVRVTDLTYLSKVGIPGPRRKKAHCLYSVTLTKCVGEFNESGRSRCFDLFHCIDEMLFQTYQREKMEIIVNIVPGHDYHDYHTNKYFSKAGGERDCG